MEEKTRRMLLAGAILIVLAGGIFGGWFKAAADMFKGNTPVEAAKGNTCLANGASYDEGFVLSGMRCTSGEWVQIPVTTTEPEVATTSTTTTTHEETTTTIKEETASNGTLRLDDQHYIEYNGYEFMLDHGIYGLGYRLDGILVDVIKPNGVEDRVVVGETADGQVDSLKIHFEGTYFERKTGDLSWATVSILDANESMNYLKVGSGNYTATYDGYKFMLEHFIYDKGYKIFGALIDVQKPDGSVVEVQVDNQANGVVDKIEMGINTTGSRDNESDQYALIYIV